MHITTSRLNNFHTNRWVNRSVLEWHFLGTDDGELGDSEPQCREKIHSHWTALFWSSLIKWYLCWSFNVRWTKLQAEQFYNSSIALSRPTQIQFALQAYYCQQIFVHTTVYNSLSSRVQVFTSSTSKSVFTQPKKRGYASNTCNQYLSQWHTPWSAISDTPSLTLIHDYALWPTGFISAIHSISPFLMQLQVCLSLDMAT